MSTLGTITQRIYDEMVDVTSSDQNRVWSAICRAIDRYKKYRFFFNEGFDTWLSTVGEADYGSDTSEGGTGSVGYPDDLMSVDSIQIQLDTALYEPLVQLPVRVIDDAVRSTTIQGLARAYSWHNQVIHFDRKAHVVYTYRIRYLKDIGVPTYSYVSPSWLFVEPNGTTTLTASFTNGWFTEAEDLLVYRSMWWLYLSWLKDKESAMAARELEDEALTTLYSQSRAFDSTMGTTPTNF